MDKIFFLIDTNIVIQLEDNQIVNNAFAKFYNLCNKNSAVIYIHPLSKKEIQKDKDENRKKSILSKIDKYTLLVNPPSADEQQLKKLFGKINKTNDEIDCQLLYALFKNSVAFLVTEDIRIHQRAKKVDLKNKVFTVNQANNMLERLFPPPNEIILPTINNPYIYNINDKDQIFDSLKDEYTDFAKWFKKCSQEQEKAWTVCPPLDNTPLEAICIYKEAKEEDYIKYKLPKKSLKLATFKVAESHRGKKLGELMLKQAFLYAVKNKFKSCWMTAFPKYKVLIDFIKDFGFVEIGHTDRKDKKMKETELVFQKVFVKPKNYPLSGLDFHIKYSPLYDDRKKIGKYIIPIQEKYYEILFPEYNAPDFEEYQIPFAGLDLPSRTGTPGRTIKKVYLCHSPIKQLKTGDLLFFYVSDPIQAIRSIGVVESVFRSDELLKVVSHIGKRSVYSFLEIEKMIKNKVLVIEFRFIKHLKRDITLKELKDKRIIKAHPQSIQNLTNYKMLKNIFF